MWQKKKCQKIKNKCLVFFKNQNKTLKDTWNGKFISDFADKDEQSLPCYFCNLLKVFFFNEKCFERTVVDKFKRENAFYFKLQGFTTWINLSSRIFQYVPFASNTGWLWVIAENLDIIFWSSLHNLFKILF